VVSRRNSVSTVTNGKEAMRRHTSASSDVVVIGCMDIIVPESGIIVGA
jgi:hypothetical protein